MRKSTAKRIKRRLENLPSLFIDSSVFIELLFKQQGFAICESFFGRARYKYRLIASTVVMGEVIKAINEIPSTEAKKQEMLLFTDLLTRATIKIIAVSNAALHSLEAVKQADERLQSSDLLIFSSAVTEKCDIFVTLDPDFTQILGKSCSVIIRKPQEI